MTAAHCSFGAQGCSFGYELVVKDLSVLVGAHDFSRSDKTGIEHQIRNHYHHPLYQPDKHPYDYAIYELEDPIYLKPKWAMAVYLPTKADGRFEDYTQFVVSGWGAQDFGPTPYRPNGAGKCYSDVLNALKVYFVPHAKCKDMYRKCTDCFENQKKITETMMCAADKGMGKKDSCTGDSGGPLTWLDTKTDEVKLIGVVSFGKGCANASYPGVYADMKWGMGWIKEIIGFSNERECYYGNCATGKNLDRGVKKEFYPRVNKSGL